MIQLSSRFVNCWLLLSCLVFTLMITACEREKLLDTETIEPTVTAPASDISDGAPRWIISTPEEETTRGLPTLLGRMRANPFEHSNMLAVYREMLGEGVPALNISHRLVRFDPQSYGEADDIDMAYATFPFDPRYEVLQLGEQYREPGLAEDAIAPVWVVVDGDESIPDAFTHKILVDLYLPPSGADRLEKLAFERVGEPYEEEEGVSVFARTDDNCEACSPDDPRYPECLIRPIEEFGECHGGGGGGGGGGGSTNSCGCTIPTSYRRISGCIRVEDQGALAAQLANVPGVGQRELVPVHGAQIDAWDGWFVRKQDHSNAQGCFEIPHTWSRARRVRIWTKWRNSRTKVHGWTPGTGSAIRLGIDRDMGSYRVRTGTGLNRLNIVYTNIGDRRSRSQVWYQACHAINSVARAYEFSLVRGIPSPPRGLRVVISNANDGAGAAPMLKQTGATWLIGSSLSAFLGGPSSLALQQLIPDVWLNYGSRTAAAINRTGARAQNVPMHEMGHTVHFRETSSTQWLSNVSFIIGLAGRRIIDDNDQRFIAPYGDGTNPGSGWCATIEAWGEYYGASAMGDYYGDEFDAGNATGNNGLEGFIPGFPGERIMGIANANWIPEGLPLDLEDNANPFWDGMRNSRIIRTDDIVGGLTMARYYQAMTSAGNRPNPRDVRNRLLARFLPQGQLRADYIEAYESYGY